MSSLCRPNNVLLARPSKQRKRMKAWMWIPRCCWGKPNYWLRFPTWIFIIDSVWILSRSILFSIILLKAEKLYWTSGWRGFSLLWVSVCFIQTTQVQKYNSYRERYRKVTCGEENWPKASVFPFVVGSSPEQACSWSSWLSSWQVRSLNSGGVRELGSVGNNSFREYSGLR